MTGASLGGCLGSGGDDGRPTVSGTRDGGGEDGPPTEVPRGATLGYTHATPAGNRVLQGQGAVPAAVPVDVPLDGMPAWIAAAPDPGSRGGSSSGRSSDPAGAAAGVWVAALEDGRLQAVRIPGRDGAFDRVAVTPERLPGGTPPLVAVTGDDVRAVAPPAGASRLSHPVPVAGRTLYVDGNGDVVVRGEREHRFQVSALPDARPAVAGSRAYVPADATDHYDHGALGDGTEAGSVVAIDASVPGITGRIDHDPAVFEGVAPILTGAWGDPAVVVTEADGERGARVVAYRLTGEQIAAGEAIGTGFRWRHQLCVAPFAPDGVPELAAVRTPHIGGTVEFYRREDEGLRIAARISGYSSHTFGSRNLDGALAGDLDGDGRLELAVPTDARDRIGAIRRTQTGAEAAWHLPVDGEVTTNLAAAPREGRLALGVGRRAGLRVW